jgi:hypothetical protein
LTNLAGLMVLLVDKSALANFLSRILFHRLLAEGSGLRDQSLNVRLANGMDQSLGCTYLGGHYFRWDACLEHIRSCTSQRSVSCACEWERGINGVKFVEIHIYFMI